MKRVLSILLILLGIAQFIRPDTALPAHDPAHDLITVTQPGAAVTDLLHVACYDCHSSETRYPWYVNITPVNWWLQHHVNEGREEFNMSEWGRHKAKWQRHKAEEAVEL
ncbi:MAG: heme-binding domain-containing protein, partial [Flavobacteriales bacterium]|nr:heme-binding domain-containing protein [Flavobacteriales bacterium]